MKKNFPVTDVEKDLGDRTNILSITDAKGIITYVNKEFTDIAGFTREELVGKNHNIIRHPEMPPAAFQDLWDHMKAGKPWMGVVKNRCKNGDHYWVDAFAIPIMGNGAIKECQSVRVRPKPEWVERAQGLYQRINDGKRLFSPRLTIGLRTHIFFTIALALVPVVASALWYTTQSLGSTLAAVGLSAAIALLGVKLCYRRVAVLVRRSQNIVHNPISQYVYTGRLDDLSQLELGYKMLEAELGAVTGRLVDSMLQLDGVAQGTLNTVRHTQEQLLQQQTDTNQVAVAMDEMAATAEQVAGNAHNAEVSTKNAKQEADSVIDKVQQTVKTVEQLASGVVDAAQVIEQLQRSAKDIGSVLDVIKTVAEQTNLLALNAAIEAARAGEQGRGFAVVADEVRSLANRTQESTQEIEGMIQNLQGQAQRAVQAMHSGKAQAENGVQEIMQAGQVLRSAIDSIHAITDLNMQIATAAEEQSQVAVTINNSLSNINTTTEKTVEDAQQTSDMSATLALQVGSLKNLIAQFRQRLGLVHGKQSE